MRLLRLYPRAWRERYAAELIALLEQHDVTLATRLDLLRGACDAWLDQGRFPMTTTPTAATLRGAACLGLLPCLLGVAQFLLVLDLRADTTLINLAAGATLPAWFLVCLWAGKRAAERGGWSRRLLAGAVAGAVGAVTVLLVSDVLDLVSFGFDTFGIVNHPHALVFDGAAAGHLWHSLASTLPQTAVAVAVATGVGAAVGAGLGTLANVLMPRVAGWLLGGPSREVPAS